MTLVNQLSEVQRIPAILEEFAAANGLANKIVLDLNLVLEELLINTISYGYDDDREHEIAVRVSIRQGTLTVEYEDDGKAFNPLTAPPPDIGVTLEDRAIGGLGVYLAKNLMDRIDYVRESGRNRLSMTKSL